MTGIVEWIKGEPCTITIVTIYLQVCGLIIHFPITDPDRVHGTGIMTFLLYQ